MRRDRTLGERRREPPSADRPFKVSFDPSPFSPLPFPSVGSVVATRLRCLLNSLNAQIAYRVSVLKRDHLLPRSFPFHTIALLYAYYFLVIIVIIYLLQKENFYRKNRVDPRIRWYNFRRETPWSNMRRGPTVFAKRIRYKSVQRYLAMDNGRKVGGMECPFLLFFYYFFFLPFFFFFENWTRYRSWVTRYILYIYI